MEKVAVMDLIWLLCYLHCLWREKNFKEGEIVMHDFVSDMFGNNSKFETRAAFNLLSATDKVFRTNHSVIDAPNMLAMDQSSDIIYCITLSTEDQYFSSRNTEGNSHTLNLDLDEKTVKIRADTGHTNFCIYGRDVHNLRVLRLWERCALLTSLGRYIERSDLDDIWIEKGLYGPA